MLEVVYRIYYVRTEEEHQEWLKKIDAENNPVYESFDRKVEVALDCLICEDRESFKNTIRDLYGKDTKFAYSKKIKGGEYYCIIIGEHCWNTEKYFNRVEYNCDYCGVKVKNYSQVYWQFDSYEIKTNLGGDSKYKKMNFCCYKCKERFKEEESKKLYGEEDFGLDSWACKDDFSKDYSGYIYKITKKSTGEFYVGQTAYAPPFRWAQHLKTERFRIKNILDYKFETIELVPIGTNILERETYWIQKLYKENPELSLNIMQTQSLRKE